MLDVIPEFTTMMSSFPKSVAICWIAFSISSWSPTSVLYAAALTLFSDAIDEAVSAAALDEL